MPISREPQVSDLGIRDREMANLGLVQHSPRSPRTVPPAPGRRVSRGHRTPLLLGAPVGP